MPNLITRYDNGTFEAAAATWNAEPAFDVTIVREDVEFFEGIHSGKLIFGKDFTPANTFGSFQPLQIRFPAVQGTAYEIKIRIKVGDDIPDDVVFFLSPFQPDFSQELKGFTIPVRASTARAGWIELRANYYANVVGGEAYFYVQAILDSVEFSAQAEFYPPGWSEFLNACFGFLVNATIPDTSFIFLDAANAEAKAIPDIEDLLNLQFVGRRLYYVQNVFYLQVGGTRTVIDEPIKWDDVQIASIWDKKSKAYRFEFSDKDVLLEFDNRAGREILRENYRLLGSNADVRLLFGEYDSIADVLTILYEGSINFGPGSAEDNEITFKANIERQSFGEKLRVYFDTRANIFREDSLGGLALAPIALKDLFLHPRLLTFKAKYIYNPRVEPDVVLISEPVFGGDQQFKSAVPPFTYTVRTPGGDSTVTNNIEGLVEPTPPDGRLIYAGLDLSPGITKRTFRFDNVRLSFSFTMGNTSAELFAGVAIYKKSLIAAGPNDADLFVPLADLQIAQYSSYGNVAGNKTFIGFLSGTIDLFADEALFIKAFFYQSNTAAYSITNFLFTNPDAWTMEVNEQTVYSPSIIQAPRIHEVINRQLEIILDTVRPLKSSLLGRIDLGYAANGCASDHFTMDGKIVRKFKDKAFNLSAKEWYNALDGLFNMGMSIERDEDEVESVRLEEMPYFFRDVLLIDLQVISGYIRRPAGDYLFNEMIFGFKKYPRDNQQDSLDDFHTRMEYITPLKKIKNKLEVTIDAILSGNYFEYTRQQSFNTNPTNAYETDDDLFILSAKAADAVHAGVDLIFDDVAQTITIFKIIPIVAGDYILIAAGTGGVTNGLYEVNRADVSFFYDKMILSVAEALPSNGAGTGNVTITDSASVPVQRYQAKRDEDFSSISGVNFPKSVYNLEHHLKRVALRWAKMFQAGWTFVFGDGGFNPEGVTFTSGANNTGVITRLKPEVACKYGDAQRLDRADAFFVSVDEMDRPKFGKDEIEFDAPLTWTTFNYMRKAYEGRNPDGKDYGFIQWRNPDGEIERGYNLGMRFNPNTQMCKFTLILRYDGD